MHCGKSLIHAITTIEQQLVKNDRTIAEKYFCLILGEVSPPLIYPLLPMRNPVRFREKTKSKIPFFTNFCFDWPYLGGLYVIRFPIFRLGTNGFFEKFQKSLQRINFTQVPTEPFASLVKIKLFYYAFSSIFQKQI